MSILSHIAIAPTLEASMKSILRTNMARDMYLV